MLVFAIDDERPALNTLHAAITEAMPDAEIQAFRAANDALKAVEENGIKPDIVFSDIQMPGIDGLELAVRIKTASPDTIIVFVTGYSSYALRAFQIHADGYLLKPVRAEHILEEISHLRIALPGGADRIKVQCFGNFELFWNGRPLSFKRRKSKELLAFLIDRNGAFCMAEEIIAVLWEDEIRLKNGKHNLRNLVNDIKATLSKIGQEKIFLRESGKLAVDRSAVDCDYYRMLAGDVKAVNAYRGEYMKQYSWAELTTAGIHFVEL